MIDALEIAGALLLFIAVACVSYETIASAQRNLSKPGTRIPLVRSALVVVGAVIGIVLASTTWRWTPTESAIGLPLPWLIWESSSPGQGDGSIVFVLAWAADIMIGLALPHLPVAIVFAIRTRRLAHANDAT